MEFDKYLEFLHKVHESISQQKHDNPQLTDYQIVEMAMPSSPFFNEKFGKDFSELSPVYQLDYKNNIENIYNFREQTISGEKNLIKENGAESALRRVFEKIAKDEFNHLERSGEGLRKDSFQDFIESIKKNGGKFGFEMHINNFDENYERLKAMPDEKIKEAIQLDKNIHNNYKEADLIEKKISGEQLKKLYPEKFDGLQEGTEKYNNAVDDIMNDLYRSNPQQYEKISELHRNDPEWRKAYDKYQNSISEYNQKVPGVIDLYIKDQDYYQYKPNGLEFPRLEYDGGGKQMKKPTPCECDVNIKMDISFKKISDENKDVLAGLQGLSVSSGTSYALNNKSESRELG
jgi:hypothetical protein